MMICLTFIVVASMVVEGLGYWWHPLLVEKGNVYQNNSLRCLRSPRCKLHGLKIENCDITISRLGNEKLTATYEKTCEIKDAKFIFYFGREGGYLINFESKNPFITVDDMKKRLQNKYFEIGTHFIWVKMQAYTMKNEALAASSEQCHFYVRPENATATLGRLNKNVKQGVNIVVDASKSKNNDVGKMNVGLLYKWSCTDDVGFCSGRDLGSGSRISVNRKYAKEGAHFNFTVEVRTEQTPWQKAVQFINVNTSMPYAINCIKNCGKDPNTWSPGTSPWIYTECQFFCEKFRRQYVKGKLIDERGKVLDEFSNFATSPRAIGDVKKPGGRYKVLAYHERNKEVTIVGETEFYTFPLPKLENCKSVPPKGSPLTKFKITCDYDKESAKMFLLEIKTNNTVVFSMSADTLEEMEFLVSSKSDVLISIEDKNEVTNHQDVVVDVEPLPESGGNITHVTDALTGIHEGEEGINSVFQLIQEGEYEMALQVIGIIASAISNVETNTDKDKQMVHSLKKELLTDLTQVPIETIDTTKSVSGIVSMLAKTNANDAPDSDMAKLFAKICSELAKKQLYLLENDSTGKVNDTDVATIARNLLSCADTETNPNYEIFNQTAIDFEVTTKYPIREELSEKSFEDYPQYVADDIIEDKVQDFIDAAENVLDICRDTANSMMTTLDPKMKSPKYIYGMKSIIALMKSTGKLLTTAEFKQHNVTIVPSPFLKGIKSVLTMRVCSYEYNPFWSASLEIQIPTSVLDVSIMKMSEKKELTNFGNSPMNISFELLKNSKVKTKVTQASLVQPAWSARYKEDNFTIFIVEAKKGESFFIEFYNLTTGDDIEMVIGNMRRPTHRLFADAIHVDVNKPKWFIDVSEKDGDKWYLIAMKPNSAMKINGTMKVWFSVYTPRCIRWETHSKSWKFACSVYITTNHQTIHCRCLHLSTLAGSIEYNYLKEHPKFYQIEFYLEHEGSLFIISVVVIIVFSYFFLLMYSAQKNETAEDAVFFLADVPAKCRYGYLIIVKTGERIGSGTTSDIVIEVVGSNGTSLAHVLNFPDPFFELLRRSGEDYLVFATYFHLGPLRRINLWFDCSGSSPNWFCHSMKICDLQTKKWYNFKVKKWLRIDGNPRLFISVPVSDKDVDESKFTKKRFFNGLLKFGQLKHTMWQLMKRSSDPNFGPTKSLTMMLSVVLSVMSITLQFYTRPEFLPRDSITENCYYSFRLKTLFVGLYSSTIAYFPHLAIMTAFKKSRVQFQAKTSRIALPRCCSYFCWVILAINILIHSHVLIIYGFWVLYPTIWEWTFSSFVAMIFYIFFIEFCFNVLLDILMRKSQTRIVNFRRILKNVEVQRKHLYDFFGHYVYRPILDPVYNFLSGAGYSAKKRRAYFRQKRDVAWQIQDLLMTIALMVFFYLIVRGERDQVYDINGHQEVINLLQGTKNKLVRLDTITQTSDFQDYIEKTFIPAIQSYQWYGRYMSRNPGMTSDACNKYLGVVRLRQHRVEAESCSVVEPMQFLKTTCYSSLYFFQYDYQNYTPHWNITIPNIYKSRLGYVWGFQRNTGNSFIADIAYYPMGGYIALLGRTMNNSYINFNYLKRQNWMDHRTRVVIIEFCLYNVNSNLFHFVQILVGRTPTGYIDSDVKVTTERVLKYGSRTNTISLICVFIFIIFVVMISFRITMRLYKTRTWYKRDLWHLVDIGIVALSVSWVVMHFKKLSLLQDFAKELEEKRSNDFVDFFPMLGVIGTLNFLTSSLVCLTIIRIWKLLRFAAIFRVVERTLMLSFETLCIMFIVLVIFFIGFGFMSFIFLGSKLKEFKDWYFILKILLSLLSETQKSSPENLGQNERGLGYVFFVLYAIFCQVITTMFVAVIVYNYQKARTYAFEERIEYSMKDYAKEKLQQIKLLAAMWMDKFRLRAGASEEQEHVNPKEPCSRYMNFVETDSNRMQAMLSVTKCVLTKKLKGLRVDESDHAMMLKTIFHLSNKNPGKREIFFVEGNIISGFTFVDDRKISKMEKVVKSLLESPQERALRRKGTDLIEALRADNAARMMQMNYRLKLMLQTVKKIEIAVAPRK